MKISVYCAIILAMLTAFALVLPDSGEAARMGGGRSFGSQPYMSRPAAPPISRQQSPAARQPMAQAVQNPGMFGGMGGLFGGLLAGTLLGSLLGGHGFSGGGFLDIILFGLLIFFGLKLFARMRNRPAPSPAGASTLEDRQTDTFKQNSVFQRSDTSGWDALREQNHTGASPFSATPRVDIPADFNVDEFLRGAKMAYNRLQKSWDRRDLADIAQFATPPVMAALEEQLAGDAEPGNTEILLVNAQLLGVENEGDDLLAHVYFDVLMRENQTQQTPDSVREVWHFLRKGKEGSWKLDGIQQVE